MVPKPIHLCIALSSSILCQIILLRTLAVHSPLMVTSAGSGSEGVPDGCVVLLLERQTQWNSEKVERDGQPRFTGAMASKWGGGNKGEVGRTSACENQVCKTQENQTGSKVRHPEWFVAGVPQS